MNVDNSETPSTYIDNKNKDFWNELCGTIMVFNAFSYRKFINNPISVLMKLGTTTPISGDSKERAAYDKNITGQENPFTDFISKKGMMKITAPLFEILDVYKENVDSYKYINRIVPRKILLLLGPIFGLDLYVHLRKII